MHASNPHEFQLMLQVANEKAEGSKCIAGNKGRYLVKPDYNIKVQTYPLLALLQLLPSIQSEYSL